MANIIVFGDSITFGMYDDEGGWVDRLKKHLLKISIENKLEHDLKVYNLGISGDTSEQFLKRFDQEIEPRNWVDQETIIIVSFGLNDSILINKKNKVPIDKSKKNIKLLLNKARSYSKKVMVMGPTPVEEEKVSPMPWSPAESWNNENIRKYNKIVKLICKQLKVDYLNLFDLFFKMDYKKMMSDGAHPNTKGHEIIFNTVKNFLEEKKYI
jgi:lysophospholipase L1-like esterase